MSPFWSAFWGKICATIFIAVCIFLGFGPKEWVAAVLGVDTPIWVLFVRVILIGGAVGTAWLVFARKLIRKNADDIPNWPLKDAFQYLMIDSKWVVNRSPDDDGFYWDIEGEIRDKASLGYLSMWVRPTQQVWGGASESAKKLSEREWDDLKIDLVSCVFDGFESAHLVNMQSQHPDKYEDVKVNRKQFVSLWPRANLLDRWRDKKRSRRIEFLEQERRGSHVNG